MSSSNLKSKRDENDDTSGQSSAIKRSKRALKGSDLDKTSAFLCPSPSQMRTLLDHDNICAHKYMGAPLRKCSSMEPPDQPGTTELSPQRMALILEQITDMWRQMSKVLEIFTDTKHPCLGYRLRVIKDLPIKLNIRESDLVVIGWKAVFPDTGPSHHLYLRSDLNEGHQYLGGPVAYANWAPKNSATFRVRQVSTGSVRHLVRAEVKSASGGTEMLWDYGHTEMPDFTNFGKWFNPQCCSISNMVDRPLPKKQKEIFQDSCVLCGQPYRSPERDATKRNPQKKVHLLNSHADFLGSQWDGLGDFNLEQYTVNYNAALLEAERINRLLSRLESENWKIAPACKVLTAKELDLEESTIMKLFKERCALLKKCGTVVLRGRTFPTTSEQLLAIRPSNWSKVFPNKEDKPPRMYALSKADMVTYQQELADWTIQDMMMIFDSEED